MDFNELYARHEANLEDFWGRRQNGPRFRREFTLFGRPMCVTGNQERILAAVDHSLPLYATAPTTDHPPLSIHLVVRQAAVDPGPVPENLLDVIQYAGYGNWLSLRIGGWGHGHVDLAAGRAVVVLTPPLGGRPDLVSRGILNTIFNNLMTEQGFSMLHCTGLLRHGRALLLMAPHNSGKSTTALRLVMAGYRLLSDSQIYVSPDSDEIQLLGFPVGKVKLRRDMVPEFPQLRPFLEAEPVREETKFSLNLRRLHPDRVQTTAVSPHSIDLCLLSQGGSPETELTPAAETAVWDAIMANSIFYDTAEAWRRNLAPVRRLVARARAHHLAIGRDPDGIIATIDSIRPQTGSAQ